MHTLYYDVCMSNCVRLCMMGRFAETTNFLSLRNFGRMPNRYFRQLETEATEAAAAVRLHWLLLLLLLLVSLAKQKLSHDPGCMHYLRHFDNSMTEQVALICISTNHTFAYEVTCTHNLKRLYTLWLCIYDVLYRLQTVHLPQHFCSVFHATQYTSVCICWEEHTQKGQEGIHAYVVCRPIHRPMYVLHASMQTYIYIYVCMHACVHACTYVECRDVIWEQGDSP